MTTIIKVKRGLRKDLPSEGHEGEPFFCMDTKEFYMGNGMGKELSKIAAYFQADGGTASSQYGGTQGIDGGVA